MTFPNPGLSARHYFKHFIVGLCFCVLFLLVSLNLAHGRPLTLFLLKAYAAANVVFYPFAQVVLARSSYFATLGSQSSSNRIDETEDQSISDAIFSLFMSIVLPYMLFWLIALPVLPWALASLRARPD